jgi:AcrR family transcriptional regulator
VVGMWFVSRVSVAGGRRDERQGWVTGEAVGCVVHRTGNGNSTLYDMSTGRAPRGSSKLQQKLAAKAARQAEIAEKAKRASLRKRAEADKQERAAAKADRRREAIEAISERVGGGGIWTREQPAGRQARFTRDAIARAAVRIADTEGLDALSMRRLAADLGAGTMTLYHYVRTKDELLALVVDAVMGEVAVPDDVRLPDGWRAAITMVAVRSQATLLRHPWMLDITEDPVFGPNGVRHFDQTLEALASLCADLERKIDVAMLVDEYVFGYCLHRRSFVVDAEPTRGRQLIRYVETLLATGHYPQLSVLAERLGLSDAWAQIQRQAGDDSRFLRNLNRLLDGVERELQAG